MPENQNQQNPQGSGVFTLLQPPKLYGVFALVLLGLAAFLFVGVYTHGAEPAEPQSAATAASTDPFVDTQLQARAAIVIDLATGKTLYALNPDAQLPLASLTKVSLALAVAEVLDADSFITIPYDTAMTIGGQRLKAGQTWHVQDVINFTLIASSNEGAEMLADAAGTAIRAKYPDAPREGSARSATLWRMNNFAAASGFTGMYFLNVSGLDESETLGGAFGTARSVANLYAYAARTAPTTFTATTEDGLLMDDREGDTTAAFNTNEALGAIPGLIMGKTGYTNLAGGNIAVVYDVGLARPVVAVVLGSTHAGRFSDVKQLVEATRVAIASQ